MPSFSKFDERRGGKNLAEKPMRYRRRVWTVTGVLLLAVGLQLHAQQADLDAAAAKAAADREALTHAPANIPRPVGTFITFDVPEFLAHGFLRNANGALTTFDAPGAALIGTVPDNINPTGAIAEKGSPKAKRGSKAKRQKGKGVASIQKTKETSILPTTKRLEAFGTMRATFSCAESEVMAAASYTNKGAVVSEALVPSGQARDGHLCFV